MMMLDTANWKARLRAYLDDRDGEALDRFESPPTRMHSATLLGVIGAKPSPLSYGVLRSVMLDLGWKPSANIVICGTQGKGFRR
ncbi:hypothetical protein [Bradyrhizobium sp. S3.2.12]|uniref:hypothetical protein n=1 Tax=Bradyrhizobium sp. S3.2.12 TaxID=3156387 RepID=UPI003390B335